MELTAALELDQVTRIFGHSVAVNRVSISAQPGEFLTLLGPSGSGKTTTLRLIGGFETPDSGTIKISGARVDQLPAYKRDTATVFQSGALFPHKTVGENVAYGLRMRGVARAQIAPQVARALSIVRLDGYADRYPGQLSGGQQQRVALARSVVVRPALLLFDEPLSALDLTLKLQLRAEIKRLHGELGFTGVYVTHDQSEAMALSSRVAVMNKGHIEQIGSPKQVFEAPENEFVHTFIGESCCLPITIVDGSVFDGDRNPVHLVLRDELPDGDWRLYVRPTRFRLGPEADATENRLDVELQFIEFLGEVSRYHFLAGGLTVFADFRGEPKHQPRTKIVLGWASADMAAYR